MIKFTSRQPVPAWVKSLTANTEVATGRAAPDHDGSRIVAESLQALRPARLISTIGDPLSLANLGLRQPPKGRPDPLFFQSQRAPQRLSCDTVAAGTLFLDVVLGLPDGLTLASTDIALLNARARQDGVTGKEIATVISGLSTIDALRAVSVAAQLHHAEVKGVKEPNPESRWSLALLYLSLTSRSGFLVEAAEDARTRGRGVFDYQAAAWTTLREFSRGAGALLDAESLEVLGNLDVGSLHKWREAVGKYPQTERGALTKLAGVCRYSGALPKLFVEWAVRSDGVAEIATAYQHARQYLDRFSANIGSLARMIGSDSQLFAEHILSRARGDLDRVVLNRMLKDSTPEPASSTVCKLLDMSYGHAISAALTRKLVSEGSGIEQLPSLEFVVDRISSFDSDFVEKLKKLSFATVYQIYNKAGADYFYGRFLSACAQGTARVYALVDEGAPISFLIADEVGERTYLGSLNATFAFLGSGAGSALLTAVVAREGALKTLFALIHPDNPVLNEVKKLDFYVLAKTESGLVEVERRPGGGGE